MKKSDGTWMKPPPNHAAIFTDHSVHNLDSFISMKQGLVCIAFSSILTLADEFCCRSALTRQAWSRPATVKKYFF